jgi:hypothetical protein
VPSSAHQVQDKRKRGKKNLGAPLRGHYYYEGDGEKKRNKGKEIKYQIVKKRERRIDRCNVERPQQPGNSGMGGG